ncbi:MAG: tRNA-dihydrouridine synthase, partial [Clostridiales bacterium]
MDGFSIGDLQLSNRVLTAPIAGVTGRAFRDILHSQGPGLIYTEMVSAQALCYENIKTFELVDLLGEEKPVGVQLCGSNPQVMAEAAQIIEAMGVDIIDINMGCPAPKVVRNQEGASLMLRPHDAYEIIYRVKKAVKVPVTAKFRSGWDEDHLNCLEFAGILQDAGADALTVHGRTR